MTAYLIRSANWPADKERLRFIRSKVFVEEQGVPAVLEWQDENVERGALHWLALENSRPVGAARLLPDGKISRVAVLKEKRGQGVGKALMAALLKAAAQNNYPSLYMHAQLDVRGFYEKFGFVRVGDFFEEAGIVHCRMVYAATIL